MQIKTSVASRGKNKNIGNQTHTIIAVIGSV
jgi:hypothetical protein